jgi:hypothetical protein
MDVIETLRKLYLVTVVAFFSKGSLVQISLSVLVSVMALCCTRIFTITSFFDSFFFSPLVNNIMEKGPAPTMHLLNSNSPLPPSFPLSLFLSLSVSLSLFFSFRFALCTVCVCVVWPSGANHPPDHLYALPYRERWLNVLQGSCLFLIWLTLQAGMLLQTTTPDFASGGAVLTALSIANIIVFASPIVMVLLALCRVLPRPWRKRLSACVGLSMVEDADEDLTDAAAGDVPAPAPSGSRVPRNKVAADSGIELAPLPPMVVVTATDDPLPPTIAHVSARRATLEALNALTVNPIAVSLAIPNSSNHPARVSVGATQRRRSDQTTPGRAPDTTELSDATEFWPTF